ncbi:MAG: PhnD/SsuA/transferrin family substrate-binding protein [Anaerolineae bacterium]|nr:PhnD/SsuA/transferrin family substrate-binding protein [Anaerolineae bacterium]
MKQWNTNCGRCIINRRASFWLILAAGAVLLALVAAGCSNDQGETGPVVTRPPTAIPPTPTPRSTALPDVPNVPLLGDNQRPIALLFVLPDGNDDSKAVDAKNALRDYFRELDITIDVQFVEDDAVALKAVCNQSEEGYPTAAWVNPFTMIIAQDKCEAVPVLTVNRGSGRALSVGQTADIVSRADVSSISGLRSLAFCRLGADDFTSWVFPSLVMASQGVDPLTDLSAVHDYPNNLSMLRALYDGDCSAAAFPPDELENLLDELADELHDEDENFVPGTLDETIKVLRSAGDASFPTDAERWQGFESGVIPYDGLVFPPERIIPADLRQQIVEGILDFADSRAGQGLLDDILDASGFVEVAPDDYRAFHSLIVQAKWDMTFAE